MRGYEMQQQTPPTISKTLQDACNNMLDRWNALQQVFDGTPTNLGGSASGMKMTKEFISEARTEIKKLTQVLDYLEFQVDLKLHGPSLESREHVISEPDP